MNRLLTLFLLASFSLMMTTSHAQQDAQYTQYMYNTISVNPGYAGSRGVLSVVGLHRNQWVNLDGAPRTQTLSVHSPIGENNKVGLGVSLVNDEIGPTDETSINVDFSYTIPTSERGKLSFGVKGGVHILNVNFQKLKKFYSDDPLFESGNIDNKFSPNVGLGMYYHTDKFYLGLSIPSILETDHFDSSTKLDGNNSLTSASFIAEERMNYYMITGYVFDLSDTVKFKPAVLSKLVFGAPLQVDVSANFMLYNRVNLGVAYRWSSAVSAMAGFQISDAMMIGFAYDYEATELGNTEFNDGSYEVMMRFELFKKYNRMLTPRFF